MIDFKSDECISKVKINESHGTAFTPETSGLWKEQVGGLLKVTTHIHSHNENSLSAPRDKMVWLVNKECEI